MDDPIERLPFVSKQFDQWVGCKEVWLTCDRDGWWKIHAAVPHMLSSGDWVSTNYNNLLFPQAQKYLRSPEGPIHIVCS